MMLTSESYEPATASRLPNGDTVPVFTSANGRSVLGVGHLEDDVFCEHANTLLGAYGQPTSVDDGCVLRRYALIILEDDGSLTIKWNVEGTWERVTDATPGALPVTLAEL